MDNRTTDRKNPKDEMEILWEDDALIVCYKPAGLATETAKLGQQDMVSLLRNTRAARGETPWIGTVHRLDQPVEGLLVFAKTREAAAALSGQVKEQSIGKYYCAVGRACGSRQTPRDREEWTDYIRFDRKRNFSVITDRGDSQAKRAQLSCRVVGRQEDLVCFAVSLHTGRHHQIRVQMAHRGFPLVGDGRYGTKEAAQLALCAYRLKFVHPTTKKEMDFTIHPRNRIFEPFREAIPEYTP